jgi:predicted deacetylase
VTAGSVSLRLVVSVHGVGSATIAGIRHWLDALDQRRVPASLLVIPGPWRNGSLALDRATQSFLRDRRACGDEIVQHGWRHATGADACGWRSVTARAATRGSGEFAALSYGSAMLRLRAGRDVLRAAGLGTDAFTAPGWLHSPGTLHALRELGFHYTTTRLGVLELRTGSQIRGLALSYRPGAAGERAATAMMRLGARATCRTGGLVRIALHPEDVDGPMAASTLAMIDEALDSGAVPITYSAVLGGSRLAAAG